MNTLKKTAAGTVLGGALLVGAGFGLAHAAPPAPEAQAAGDGMVSVTVTANGQEIGVLRDITVANGAALAASACPTAGIDTSTLTNLDVSGTVPASSCTGATGLSFTFAQNVVTGATDVPGQYGAGQSQDGPGQAGGEVTTPTSVTPGMQSGQGNG